MPREWRPARSWATGRSSRSEARSSGWKFPASACRSATKCTQEAGRTFTRARRTASSAAHWRSGAGTLSPTPPRPPRSSNGAPISSPRWRAGARTPAPAPAETAAILERCTDIVPALAGARVLESIAGLRPGRPEVRVELDRDLLPVPVVHNYGHGGAGITRGWGCAQDVAGLVGQLAAR